MTDQVTVRVRLLDAWDDLDLELPTSTPIGDVKRAVLAAARLDEDPSHFLVKFRGAEIRDEGRTLADEKVPPRAALIVMRRRRVPVR